MVVIASRRRSSPGVRRRGPGWLRSARNDGPNAIASTGFRTGPIRPRLPDLRIVLLPLLLAGCGLHPLYADRDSETPLAPQLASVAVDSIADRSGQMLTNELRDGFNPQSQGVPIAYRLHVDLTQGTQNQMTRPDTSASRTAVFATARWSLKRLSDDKTVLAGESRAQTGHDVLTNEYANVVSDKSDLADALREVSEDIQARVALYLRAPEEAEEVKPRYRGADEVVGPTPRK